jgi:hypothetical protein
MAGNESCFKGPLIRSSLRRQCFTKKETLLQGEESILESISSDAPLPAVLNKLCVAIDLQIGNMISVILAGEDHDLRATTENALQFGLHVFWSACIPLRDEQVLGSFQMFSCASRSPSPFELQLIERVTHLAGVAIRRHNAQDDFATFSSHGSHAAETSWRERAYLN